MQGTMTEGPEVVTVAEPLDPATFNRLAGLHAAAQRRHTRARQRLDAAHREVEDAATAARKAETDFLGYCRRAARAAPAVDLFQDQDEMVHLGEGTVVSRRALESVMTPAMVEAALAAADPAIRAQVMSGGAEGFSIGYDPRQDPTLPAQDNGAPVRIDESLIVEEAGLGDTPGAMFHVEQCGVGDFLGVCKYGADECPAGWPKEPVPGCWLCEGHHTHIHHAQGGANDGQEGQQDQQAAPDPDAPITWRREEGGTITLLVKRRELQMGQGKPRVFPAGEVEGLADPGEWFVYRNLASDAWVATQDPGEVLGQMKLSIGSITLPAEAFADAA